MSTSQNQSHTDESLLLERIKILEKRLVKVESMLRLEYVGDNKDYDDALEQEETYTVETAESHIVEYGLAWLGSIVFLFGIIFLMSFTESFGHVITSRIVAYLATTLLLAFSYFYRKSFPILTYVLNICGVLLLYYITIRLHFFSSEPIIAQKGVALIPLFLIIATQLYNAFRKNSEFLAVIGILFSITTAIFADSNLNPI